MAPPIGFTAAAGNFEGGDAVHAEALDGANTLRIGGVLVGLPNLSHVDNANMRTPPVGNAPRMQMYLWRSPQFSDFFLAASGENEADIVYHEYTHGLSNRLVVDPQGNSTLLSPQARSMGEGWSDWYAMDYLVDQGLVLDTPASGEVRLAQYVSHGFNAIRAEGFDCPVGAAAPSCPGGTNYAGGLGPGGFTYGDFGKILGVPEVHLDGEIWAETLWDLRDALGSQLSEALVTRAMELSPPDPSFLDMRNAILQADLVNFGGAHHDQIWSVFAHRGMGWYAAAIDGNDTQPVEDFHIPPAPNSPFGKLVGKVNDQDSGKPVGGIRIAFGGHSSGFTTDIAGLSGQNGLYDIKRIFVGTYPKVFASGVGFDRVVVPSVTITNTAAVLNWTVRRDWASIFGGGSIASFTGPDYTAFGCGPANAIDQSEIAGWGSNSIDNAGNHITPEIVIALPRTINVTQIAIDPANTCGDDATASVKDYQVETSPDGTTWTVANQGQFADGDRGRMNLISPTAGAAGVRFVRFTMLTQQLATDCSTNPAQSGCAFADMSEIEVYGRPA
jgi:hypothetical protein